MMYSTYQIVILLVAVLTFVSSATTDQPSATHPTNQAASDAVDTDSSLKEADVAAIVLGILLACVVIATIVICVLFKKGYLGEQEQTKVLPSVPEIYTTPESLREFSSAAIDKSNRNRGRYDTGSTEPIIYLRDDIYHPPNSRPTEENLADLKRYQSVESGLPKIHHTKGRSSRRKRKSSRLTRTIPDVRKSSLNGTQPYPNNSVFIPEKGGMKFTMFYETQSPYTERNTMSKTF